MALDLEMTGLDPDRDRICEVGVAWGGGGHVQGRWSVVIDPGVAVHHDAAALHGLGTLDFAHAPRFEEVADDVLARLDGGACVAHHAAVDRRFLHDALTRCGRGMPELLWADSLTAARRVLAASRHRLGDLCQSFGVSVDRAHRAGSDAEATLRVWFGLLELLDPDGSVPVEALPALVDGLARDGAVRVAQRELLIRAAASSRPVRLRYASRDADGRVYLSDRRLDVRRVGRREVEGFCHLRQAERAFRLDRIRDVTPWARA